MDVDSVAGYVAAMRRLKDESGLTLRNLEERAAANGDTLARSTVADLLRREKLPRQEVVAAFVRACGDGARLSDWMSTYERLAAGPAPAAPVAPEPSSSARRPWLVAGVLAVVVAAIVGTVLVVTADPRTPPNREAVLGLPSAGTWAKLHPAAAPHLCVTEGVDRSGRYRSAVAVQAPCAQPGPRTLLQPVGNNAHIKWEHPVDKVLGCLTIMDDGPADGLVEPQENCLTDKGLQLFRIEPVTEGAYRLRTSDRCLAVQGDVGSEVVAQPCRGDVSEHFLVDLHA